MSATAHSDFWKKMNGAFSGSAGTTSSPVSSKVLLQVQPAVDPTTQGQALDVLDQVLTEVEQQLPASTSQTDVVSQVPNQPSPDPLASMAQVMPQTISQATDTLNPTAAALPAKEKFTEGMSANITTEVAGNSGPVETEPPREMEMPVEVESYLQKVDNNPTQLPQEIVVADDGQTVHTKAFPKQPVIVLPLTEEQIEQGKKKSLHFSIRWLVEWSEKIMKMFSGKVIYRQAEESSS